MNGDIVKGMRYQVIKDGKVKSMAYENGKRVFIHKLDDEVKIPTRAHDTDSGFDLYAHSFKKHYRVATARNPNGQLGFTEVVTEGENILTIKDEEEDVFTVLRNNERLLIGTGIEATVGKGFEIQLRPRSGLALKQGITVLNTPGTIDEGYRGEIGVILLGTSVTPVKIKLGERIAQMVVCPVALPSIEIVDNLPRSERGATGFGDSGTS